VSHLVTTFVALLLAGGGVLLGLALRTWQRRSSSAGDSLTVMLVAAAFWVLGAAAEHLAPSVAGKLLASKIQYVGVLGIPPAALGTVLVAVGRKAWLDRLLPALTGFAALGIGLAATNELHGLIWKDLWLEPGPGFQMLELTYGPAYRFVALGGHAQLLAAFAIFVALSGRRFEPDAALVYVGFAAPWAANIAYQLRVGPWPGLDFTPLGLVVTGVAFATSFHGLGNIFSTTKLAHRDVLEHIADSILVFDRNERLLAANRAAQALLALPPLPASAARALASFEPLLAYVRGEVSDAGVDVELEAAGERRIFDVRSVPITNAELSGRAAVGGRVVVLREMTQQRASERETALARERLHQIIELMPHSVFARDASGRFLLVNDRCARVYELPAEEIVGRSPRELRGNTKIIERMLADDRRVIETRTPSTVEESYVDPTGRERTYRTTKVPLVRSDAEAPAVLGVAVDVTREKERERLLEHLASTDALTSLTNRRHFHDVLARALATARHKRQRAALLFIDLDRFKMVNDVYGHLTGDEVLREVARRIEDSVRFNDHVVAASARRPESLESPTTVSRLGGDEFIVLLPEVADAGGAALVARRLLAALAPPIETASERLELGASIGIAIFPEDGADAQTLLRHCDQALTSAKQNGRNRFDFFSNAIGAREERRHEVERALRRALERDDELSVHYQPIRHARTGELAGLEALARLTSSDLGSIRPDEFITVAEESGLVVALGRVVLRTVCGDLAAWRSEGLRIPRIAVNVSARQLADRALAGEIERVLAGTALDGSALELEVTENSILSRNPAVRETIDALRAIGVSFALDDFGTGYSSLSHLRSFDFERLKIDKSFVAGIGRDAGDEELTRAVIALCQRLGIEAIAEGVETEAQLAFLRAEGCDFVQGFLLGRPAPAAQTRTLLEQTLGREKDEA